MTPAERERLAYQQAERYAEELRDLYRRQRAEAHRLHQRRQRRARVRTVLKGDGLRMVFQPIFPLDAERPSGFEALARFDAEPRQGPDVWFRDATEAGLATELELLAMSMAVEQLERLPDDTYLGVNLSPDTLMSLRFARSIASAPASRVVVEITEHAPIDDYERLAKRLRPFRDLGGRVAVDDAGAGFASLRHILALAPDIIKLDISLTRGIDGDRARTALGRALISFAHEIEARIVAEGVETPAELEALRELGVSHGQGYLLGRPGSAGEARSATR